MKAVRTTCVLVTLAFLVQAFGIASSLQAPLQPPHSTTALPVTNATTTEVPTQSTTLPTTTHPPITTPSPNTTTTPNPPPDTTTVTPSTTKVPPTPTTTPIPPSSSTTTASSTTPTHSTTAVPPTPTPCPPNDRHFDGPSFMGGIILTAGLVAIGFILWKFYKARTERNYHTL